MSAPSVAPTAGGGTSLHSLTFDGATGYAEAAAPDLNLSGSWTVELWFRDSDPNGFDHPYRYLLNKGDGSYGESPFYVLLGNGNLLAGLRTAGVNHPLTYNLHLLGFSPKIWQHLAVSFDAGSTTLTMYLNGMWVAQQSLGVRSSGNTLPLEFARQGATLAKYWLGKIDDVRVWNVVRTAVQIQANYKTELAASQPGLVANWRFDEGCGAAGSDAAGTHVVSIYAGAEWAADVPTTPNLSGVTAITSLCGP